MFPSSLGFSKSSLLVVSTREELNIIFTGARIKYNSIRKMKRWHARASILTFLITFFSFLPSTSYAAEEQARTFVVTAYYSPLPNQSFYFKGSYEAEVKLNGNGTNGASGKGVFAGMLAAPKSYSFGTKIYLEGV